VVSNLLRNAASYTDSGGTVRIAVTANEEPGRAVVRVRDTGVGIEPDLLPRLFEAFTQVESSTRRSRGGLGLGLALVKGLVELHDGGVGVASDGPGCGAEFSFWLPLCYGPPGTSRRPQP
jgi:signal transduction histidine kinase